MAESFKLVENLARLNMALPSFSSHGDHSSYTKKEDKTYTKYDHSSFTKKIDKSDTKDEPKSLTGALVSERTPDKKVISKIVTKTRGNLTETEAPCCSKPPSSGSILLLSLSSFQEPDWLLLLPGVVPPQSAWV